MSLSGTVTIWVLWLLAAATFVWGVVSWPKAKATGRLAGLWRAHLRRSLAQLAVVATALLAVAGTLNARYDWYSSWNDLGTAFAGGDSSAGSSQPIHAGGQLAAPIRSVRGPPNKGGHIPTPPPPRPADGGTSPRRPDQVRTRTTDQGAQPRPRPRWSVRDGHFPRTGKQGQCLCGALVAPVVYPTWVRSPALPGPRALPRDSRQPA